MRFPCENYLRWLLLGVDTRFSVADVQQHAKFLGFPPPPEDYLLSLRESMEHSRPKPMSLDRQDCRDWLRQQGLFGLCYQNDYVRGAMEILWDGEMRPSVEALLLSGISLEQVSESMLKICGTAPKKELLEFYCHFFWNVKHLRQDEWMDFLVNYPQGHYLKVCYISKPEYTLYHLGLGGSVDSRTQMEEMATQAYYRSEELRAEPTTELTARALKHLADVRARIFEVTLGHSQIGEILDEVRSIGMHLEEPRKVFMGVVDRSRVLDGTVMATARKSLGAGK